MEVVEELMGRFTSDQLAILDDLPENASTDEIIQRLDIKGDEVDAIRAEKTAKLIEEMVPNLNQ